MFKSNFISSFFEQVEKQPLETAIEFEGQKMSYQKLSEEAHGVCAFLKRNSAGEKYIGIKDEGGFQSYANIIGIWMFGAAYVPLNSSYPNGVVDGIVDELGLKTVLSKKGLKNISSVEGPKFIDGFVNGELAYVIHTSGSTGKPKSVLLSHENLNAFTSHYLNKDKYDFDSSDRFLQSYDLSFDVSLFCFTIPLMIGGTLVLPEDKGVKYMTVLSSILKDKITVCSNVPSVVKYALPRIAEISMDSLRYCFFSGESLYGNWAKAWMVSAKNAQVYNCYGPTETTIVCTTEHLNILELSYFESAAPLPLGDSFECMDLVINKGEVCFKGPQVFTGYANSVKPKVSIHDDLFFPTGDMAFVDEKGKLIYKGRKDEQVQINGYRVELGAIDALIQKEFSVLSKTMVVSNFGKPDEIVSVIETDEIQILKVINHLKTCLPEYSLPGSIFLTASFPLNANGKLDVIALKTWILEKLKAW